MPHTMLLLPDGTLFLWPRRHVRNAELPLAIEPGYPELAGEVIVLDEAQFERTGYEEVAAIYRERISLSEAAFDEVLAGCTSVRRPLAE